MSAAASASPTASPTPSDRFKRLFGIVLIFFIVGPPVGAIVFMMSLAMIGLGKSVDLAGLTWVALFAVIYGAPMSYIIGAAPAAAAGLLIGTRQAFFGRVSWWMAAACGLLIGLGFLVATGQPIVPSGGDAGAQPESGLVMIVTCLATTMVCWGLVRNWYFAAPAAAGATT